MAGRLHWRGALALVTGAGSGIGRATALALADRGARVLCVDIDGANAEATARACAERGVTAHAHVADVAEPDRIEELAAQIHAAHGPLDVLVNNAGVGLGARLLDMTLDDWEWIWRINVGGIVHCARAFGAAMVDAGRGHVVNVASGLAYTHRETEPAYVATKAAALALSRALRRDWRRHGVGVSVVCPGVIATPIVEHSRLRGEAASPEAVARARRLFARRGHPPERVAAAIVRAVERDRSVVPVGPEAWVGWFASRLLPVRTFDAAVAGTQRLTAPPGPGVGASLTRRRDRASRG